MRESHAEQQIPQDGAASVPYADQFEIARALMGRGAECVAGTVTGTGAALDVEDLPFDPAAVFLVNATGPFALHSPSMPDDSALKVTSDAAFITSDGITLGNKKFTIGADSDINVDDETIHWMALGFSDQGDDFS